jgi:hypothetical protein
LAQTSDLLVRAPTSLEDLKLIGGKRGNISGSDVPVGKGSVGGVKIANVGRRSNGRSLVQPRLALTSPAT